MGRFVEGVDRNQATLLPECLEDFIAEDNPVRIVDAFVDELDLESLGFEGLQEIAEVLPRTSIIYVVSSSPRPLLSVLLRIQHNICAGNTCPKKVKVSGRPRPRLWRFAAA